MMTPNWRAAERAGDDVGELVPVNGVTREPVRTRAARRCLPNRVLLREPAVLRPTTVQMRCAANVLLADEFDKFVVDPVRGIDCDTDVRAR